MAGESKVAIFAAAAANLGVAVAKLGAGFYTGSSAMLTEALHSFVDTGNEALLWLGLRRSARAADEDHPFGYGLEAYFWSFVVALMIFLLGGALSIYQGVQKIMHPEPIRMAWVNFAVLGTAFVFEAISLAVAYRQFRARTSRTSLVSAMVHSKDPSLFAIVLEDSAALAGLVIASAGVGGAVWLHLPWADGAGSIGVGLVLTGVALFLANETRSLLTGEGADRELRKAVRERLDADDRVVALEEVRTLQLGPTRVLVTATVDLGEGDATQGVARSLIERVQAVDDRIVAVFLRPPRAGRAKA